MNNEIKANVLKSEDSVHALDLIRNAGTVLLTTHEGPDGDGIGSAIALAKALRKLGKRVWIVNPNDCARAFKFLDSSGDVHILNELLDREHPHLFDEVDLGILIDTAEFERAGTPGRRLQSRKGPVTTIDHHLANERSIPGIVGPDFSSTGELMVKVIQALGIEITKEMAVPLYGAILSDTQQFRFTRQDPEVFAAAALLVAAGADPEYMAAKMYGTVTRDKMTLMARMMDTASFECGGRLVWNTVTAETTTDLSVDRDDIRSMVNLIGDIEGVEISVLFKSFRKDNIKVSMRSRGDKTVSDVAEALGGGGHSHAAGADLDGSFEEIKEKTLTMLRAKFQKPLKK